MNQPGHGFDAAPGYHPPPPYSHPIYPTFPVPPLDSHDPTRASAYNHEIAVNQPHEYNRNVIPGLGLNLSSNLAAWQQPWANSPAEAWHLTPKFQGPSGQALPDAQKAAANAMALGDSRAHEQAEDDATEEGEVSDGELEDIYEPKDSSATAGHPPSGPYGSAASNVARERSGSYSPYLSPREVHQQRPIMSREVMQNQPSTTSILTDKSVVTARKQAQDAILRLWPLNIRYQDYLDQGIDEGVLQNLFKELGFGIPSPTIVAPDAAEIQVASRTPIVFDEKPTGDEVPLPERPTSQHHAPSKPKDKSEERKDRIARLLAAKGSKSAAPTPAPQPPQAPSPVQVASDSPALKMQSEKSKLLHQKMEALRKSREGREQKRAQQATSSSFTPNLAPTADADIMAVLDSKDGSNTPDVAQATNKNSDYNENRNDKRNSSIPGLFLSSTSQPSQARGAVKAKENAVANLSESSSNPVSRSFGHGRESRPFLIDVSDDEDDAEMEIDSPGRRSSVNMAASPGQRAVTIHDVAMANDNLRYQYSSSGPITPQAGILVEDAGAMNDLANMNKKIEAMKRKIAEAEARKKNKVSRQGSPALSQANGRQPGGSPEPISKSPVQRQSVVKADVPVMPFYMDSTPQRLPKVSETRRQSPNFERRSRSRAASERLPIVEARRKEQLLKLQNLQSQMAGIQKELEESLTEEKRLREDADYESDQPGEHPAAELHELQGDLASKHSSPPRETSSPPSDAMDTTSPSEDEGPVEDADETTHGQALESPQAAMANPGGSAEQDDGMDDDIGDGPADASANASETTNHGEDVDVAMGEADSSGGKDTEGPSDGYEPTAAESAESAHRSPSFSPAPAEDTEVLEASDSDVQGLRVTSPLTHQISAGRDSASESEREVDVIPWRRVRLSETNTRSKINNRDNKASISHAAGSTFVPYETPLQYFRAYRFHPQFGQSVNGGLRSLTYSSNIDSRRELCPDELAGSACPRGSHCQFQHFDKMQTPDDQILLQLGAYGNGEDRQKQEEYIAGLRRLLTDYRTRKIKDFQTISQGIIEYRAQFLGDTSKILSLGGVTL